MTTGQWRSVSLLLLTIGVVRGEDPSQPVSFSHKKHLSLKLQCAECHKGAEQDEEIPLPSTSKCMQCHVTIAKDTPDIKKLAEIVKLKQIVPWVRVTNIPEWVFWSHNTHLKAKVECSSCHGAVSEMEVMLRATNVTTMGQCVACHQRSGAPTGCVACHEGKH